MGHEECLEVPQRDILNSPGSLPESCPKPPTRACLGTDPIAFSCSGKKPNKKNMSAFSAQEAAYGKPGILSNLALEEQKCARMKQYPQRA